MLNGNLKEKSLEDTTPRLVTPPEIFELFEKLDVIDERVEFVLGELAQKEGTKLGGGIGFTWGFLIPVAHRAV